MLSGYERANDVVDLHMSESWLSLAALGVALGGEMLSVLRFGWSAGVRDQHSDPSLFDRVQGECRDAICE